MSCSDCPKNVPPRTPRQCKCREDRTSTWRPCMKCKAAPAPAACMPKPTCGSCAQGGIRIVVDSPHEPMVGRFYNTIVRDLVNSRSYFYDCSGIWMEFGSNSATLTPVRESFNGDDSTVEFTLADAPSPHDHVLVYLNGVLQDDTSDYAYDDSTVTFSVAPDEFDKVTITYSR